MCIRDSRLRERRLERLDLLSRDRRLRLIAAREMAPDPHDLDDALPCLLYTSDAADERSSVDLGGRRIIKKKKQDRSHHYRRDITKYHKNHR